MTIEARNRMLAKEYTEVKTQIAPLEKRARELKKFFDELTGKSELDLGTWYVHYTTSKSPHYDMERLANDYNIPKEVLETYRKPNNLNLKIERVEKNRN